MTPSPAKQKAVKSIKKASLNIKQNAAMKKKKIAQNNRRKSPSSAKEIASAIVYVQNELPAKSETPDQDNVAAEVDTVSWIVISNVHANAAFENIVEVLFQNCGELRSYSFQCDPEGKFRGVIDVAFESREDAEEAVDLYHNNIKLFGRTWKLHLIDKRRCTRSSDASSTKPRFCPLTSIKVASRVAKSSHSTLSDAVRALSLQDSAVEIGVSASVRISNISSSVPTSEIVQLLFEKAGRLRSLHVKDGPTRDKTGTANVVYRRSEDAVAAVRHFANNITFFRNTWTVELDSNNPSQPLGMTSPPKSTSKQKGQSRLGR